MLIVLNNLRCRWCWVFCFLGVVIVYDLIVVVYCCLMLVRLCGVYLVRVLCYLNLCMLFILRLVFFGVTLGWVRLLCGFVLFASALGFRLIVLFIWRCIDRLFSIVVLVI